MTLAFDRQVIASALPVLPVLGQPPQPVWSAPLVAGGDAPERALRTVTVGLGELYASDVPDDVIVALGLGSCVAVVLVDPMARVGGMAHVVLPTAADGGVGDSPRFAWRAVEQLLDRVLAFGAVRGRLQCKIAGGARVIRGLSPAGSAGIGERNIEAVMAALDNFKLRPSGVDCGGTNGRSVRLTLADGRVAVRHVGFDWQDI